MRRMLIVAAGIAMFSFVGCTGANNGSSEADVAVEDTDKGVIVAAEVDKKAEVPEVAKVPCIIIETSMGTIKAELWPDKAPKTVENFLQYTEDKFFDGTIFHRVISNFMIQGGGMTADMRKKPTRAPVKNEAKADCQNLRGTLAMARTGVIDSATAQFFINLKDNGFLNHRDKSQRGFGYCVFGRVLSGMDIVDKIAAVETRPGDVPVETVTIKSIRLDG